MILDSHQHFWKFDPIRDAWIDEGMMTIRKDFLPNDLKPVLDEHYIDGCIAVQADQSEEETEFLLKLAAEHSFIKAVVGWVDFRNENIDDRLEYFVKHKKFKGVRHILQSEDEDFIEDVSFRKGFAALAQYDLTYDILIKPAQLRAIERLVDEFPRQRFVLDHLGKPNIKEGKLQDWKVDIKALAQHPNVSCKLSGMVTEADVSHWKASDFSPYMDIVFEAFGTDRVLFGSDWPVCLLAGTYRQVMNLVLLYLEQFSFTEQEKVMGGNACKWYNIKITED